MLKKLLVICSVHRKRGERIKFFNLSPFHYDTLVKNVQGDMVFTYMGQKIPVICEGWKNIDGVWLKDLNTNEGRVITLDLVYDIDD